MLFSETLMARYFTTEVIPMNVGWPKPGNPGKDTTVFRSRLTVSQWFERARLLAADGKGYSPSGGRWAGFGDQRVDNVLTDGLIHEAVKAFEQAVARLDTTLARSSPVLSPVGASFSVGRVMMGHPKAAIIRPKAKLPPKTINLTLNAWAGLKAEDIARSMSKIAKAAWEYQAAGGIVDLTITFLHSFSRPQVWNGIPHHGFMDTVKINPVSMAAFASAASGAFYRGLSIPIASVLSGQRGDGLPVCQWVNPQTHMIQGTNADDVVIERLKVR
jgi:hypothetical protein